MQFVPTAIPDVVQIIPKVFEDPRGFFMETYRRDLFLREGISMDFVQDNHSASEQGVLRGMHYQISQPQGKLVRVTVGEAFDVAVDMRRSSPTFGKWVSVRLSAQNRNQLWIPAGFAHGFYVLSPRAEVQYKTTDYYAPQCERTLLWNDSTVGIEWPIQGGSAPTLSAKDMAGKPFAQAETYP